jgi:DNA-binding NarL/FixJ family response regulator
VSPAAKKRRRGRKRVNPLTLTVREVDVLRLLAYGCTYSQIAEKLGVSLNTVASHVKNAYRKLDVHSARAAVWRAFQLRVLTDRGAG